MLFLVRHKHKHTASNLKVGKTFFLRPVPTIIWLKAVYQAVFQGDHRWKYVDISRENVPGETSILSIDDGALWCNEKEYELRKITFRESLKWCFEAVLYWTFDHSWKKVNWKRWRKTHGRGF